MNKADIRKELEQSLSSPIWDLAKNALVGQELISWGTEVIYAVQMQKLAMEDIYNQSNPSMADLVRLSNTLLTPLQLRDPSWIQLHRDEVLGTSMPPQPWIPTTLIRPYQLEAASGSAKFYNIDYITETDEVISLYQGTPNVLYMEGTPSLALDMWSSSVRKRSTTLTRATDGEHRYSYITLPITTLIDSLRVYLVNSSGFSLFHRFDPFESVGRSTDLDRSYRVFLDETGSYNIVFGMGGSVYQVLDSDNVYIEYLDLTDLDFGISFNLNEYVSSPSTQLKGVSSYTSYRSPAFRSRQFVIDDLVRKSLSATSLATLSQIEKYLKTIPSVYASKVTPDPDTLSTLNVYLVLSNNNYLDTVAFDLEKRVSLATTINASTVPSYEVYLELRFLVPYPNQSLILDWILDNYSLNRVMFDRVVYRGEISSQIFAIYGAQIDFTWSLDPLLSDPPTEFTSELYSNTTSAVFFIKNITIV